MQPAVQQHAMQRILEAPLDAEPFPHFYAESVFPDDFYEEMLARLPAEETLTCHADSGLVRAGTYKERFIFRFKPEDLLKLDAETRQFWNAINRWLSAPELMNALVNKFSPHVERRFEAHSVNIEAWQDSMLVRDTRNYALGPHTDAKHRLLSMLFYLPRDDSKPHLGTSIYRPLDPTFRCPGGPHHPFEQFERIETVAYKPNSVFGFLKTDNSFHGVERIEDQEVRRDLLMYEVKIKSVQIYRLPDQDVQAVEARS